MSFPAPSATFIQRKGTQALGSAHHLLPWYATTCLWVVLQPVPLCLRWHGHEPWVGIRAEPQGKTSSQAPAALAGGDGGEGMCPHSRAEEFQKVQYQRIIEWLRLERTFGGHLVQPPCSSRVTYSSLSRTMSIWECRASKAQNNGDLPHRCIHRIWHRVGTATCHVVKPETQNGSRMGHDSSLNGSGGSAATWLPPGHASLMLLWHYCFFYSHYKSASIMN